MSDIVSFPQAASQELIAKLVKAGYLEAGFARPPLCQVCTITGPAIAVGGPALVNPASCSYSIRGAIYLQAVASPSDLWAS